MALFGLLLCSASQLAAQSNATNVQRLVLPKGQDTAAYTLVIDLPQGREADLQRVDVLDAGSSGARIHSASAKTYYAGQDPKLFVEVVVVNGATTTTQEIALETAYQLRTRSLASRNGPQEPAESVLAGGDLVKLSVDDHGIYQLDRAFLQSLGLNPASPSQVRVYSKGGAMLPERVGQPYPVDLQEVALFEKGNGDASWDEGERLLFYGEGEDVWRFDSLLQDFTREENLYGEVTHYYVGVGGSGLRVANAAAVTPASYDDQFTALARWEEDLENLLYYRQQRFGSGQGSGQDWFGQLLGTNRTITPPTPINLGDVVSGGEGRIRARLAASPLTAGTRYEVVVNGETYPSTLISSGNRRDANASFAKFGTVNTAFRTNNGLLDMRVDYPGSLEANPGWLDYVEVTHPARTVFPGSPLFLQSTDHLVPDVYGFTISAASDQVIVFDISDPLRPSLVPAAHSGSTTQFGYRLEPGMTPRRFVALNAEATYPNPENLGAVEATNLHGVNRADVLIIYGKGLESEAERLADHRRSFDGYAVTVASMDNVADEFGGGRYDPGAVRAFARMLHERDANFRYMLLLGDAHFDPRNIKRDEPNLIPVYQTDRSANEINAYPTDDYYGLLDEGEGRQAASTDPRGALDIGIGRIPVTTTAEAKAVIDKVIRYQTDPKMLGDWRLRTVFVADDQDNNLHVNDIDRVASGNKTRVPEFNQIKVYVDAYEQIPTPGGTRIPRAAEAINQNMFRGNLVTTYLGHGGPRGWGQERFLNAPDIERWESENALPVLVTATCTFTGFDDPQTTVAGEQVLLKPRGGSVATVSTVRPVYATANFQLTRATHNLILNDSLANRRGLGLQLMSAKNSTSDGANNRKFTLFGDPAMKLAVPALDVEVTQFDSIDVVTQSDTVSVPPLREISVSGIVKLENGALAADFNGTLSLSVFDQERRARTLGQDSDSQVFEFDQQGSVLFTGRASVQNGRWTARFMLPRDVSLARGQGRLSMYASSPDGRDGAGTFGRFQIDGLAAPGVDDDTPPIVDVFLGNDAFIAGGVTSTDPVLVAQLRDDTGINVSGATIGHDLTATLRGTSEQSYVLNEFYQASEDDYRSGEARYPVFDLPQGAYELEVRAWDLANNTGTGTTSFVVSDDPSVALREVLNYPNPFVDATCFQFEHTAAGQLVEVQVDIYTTSGRQVQSLNYEGVAQGFRFGNDDCIRWDGTDRYGQQLARGVYLYKVSMRTADGERAGESDFERLVVLR